MDEREWLTERFQQHRLNLRAVAYRMLGSVSEADDALQEAWLRIRDQDPGHVENMQAWLTTIVGRVCLNMLRSRRSRRELLSVHVPDPVVSLDQDFDQDDDPEREALLADSVGLALLVVLDVLTPAERLAFVMHDVFGVPFADIATVLDRSEAAAQQLASRARRRVQGAPQPDPDLAQQRQIVAAREALGLTFRYMGEFQTEAERMLDTAMTDTQFTALVRDLWPVSEQASLRTRNSTARRDTELTYLWHDADTNAPIRGTRWAAYQAVTEYLDHYTPVGPKRDAVRVRAERAISDASTGLKTRAFDLLTVTPGGDTKDLLAA